MVQLFPAQSEIVDALLKKYQNPELTMQHHLFISGEMGTGKTYMGSAILAQLKPKHALIVCPASMPMKWGKVYQQFLPSNEANTISYFSKKKTTKADIINAKVMIVEQDNLYALVKLLYQDNEYFSDIENTIRKQVNSKYSGIDMAEFKNKFEHYFDFVIFDEIHTYKPTYQVFRAFAMLCQSDIYMLGLTGTLFRQNVSDLLCLLTTSNPEFNDLDYNTDDLRDPSWFYPNIWRYISVPISLDDVEKQRIEEDDVKQDIMPLKGLTLSEEQHAWYDLVSYNLQRLGITKKRIDQLTTSYLDLPTKQQPILKRSEVDDLTSNNKVKTRIRSCFNSGMTLTPIKLENTPKFQQLQQILHDSPDKTIIFVQDTVLGTELIHHLDRAFVIPNTLKTKDVAEYVNSRLANDYDIVVATTKQIQTGIDLNTAHQVIWYQVPSDVTAVLQAQRRVLRLNSTNSSKVWFLFYNDTAQETIIRDVSHSATNNAAAYNVRRDDNLTRLTGLLFGDFDAINEDNEKEDA